MARPPASRSVTADVPAGHVVAIRRGGRAVAEPVTLAPGDLAATVALAGLPLADLPAGTRLRIGDDAIVEIGAGDDRIPATGLADADDDEVIVPARVLAAGAARAGDAVMIEAVALPLEDALDLHPFRPEEIADVVGEYLGRAHAAGFGTVRIIHGRGHGVQRAAVRRVLAASPLVADFGDAPPDRGGWGATIVRLRGTRQ